MSGITARVIATSFALVAFALCLISGTFAGNDFSTVIYRSILVMMFTWALGRAVGVVMQVMVEDYINRYKEEKPVPTVELLSDNSDESENAKVDKELTSEANDEHQRLSNDDVDIEELLAA